MKMILCFWRIIKPQSKQLKLMFWEGYAADPVNRAYLGFGLKSGLQIPWYRWMECSERYALLCEGQLPHP